MVPRAKSISNIKTYSEEYPNSNPRLKYTGGIADNGRFLLDGTETWYYPDGTIQHQATYKLGRKVGSETYNATDGNTLWDWQHNDDNTSLWTQYWPDGNKRAQSTWKNFKCDGMSLLCDRSGKVLIGTEFDNGYLRN